MLFAVMGRSQNLAFYHQLKGDFDAFTTDNLGNFYTAQHDKITKFTFSGDTLYSNGLKLSGQIHQIDAFQSLRTMLFYKDQFQIAVLDNTLSIQGEIIELDQKGVFQPEFIAQSVNNNLWVMDMANVQLKRFDRNFEEIYESGNLNQLLNIQLDPIEMHEHNEMLYISDKNEGILVFDIYGSYIKTIPLTEIEHFQVKGDHILYVKDGLVYNYSMMDFESKRLSIPGIAKVKTARAEKNLLFVHTENTIKVFRSVGKD